MLRHSIRKLKNGMRVVFVPHADTAAATVLVLYEVGSRYETDALAGASHFIEHMMFKGTKRRPDTTTISRELDSVGADYNAFTGKDLTGYYIRLQAAKLPLAVDMLHDMLYKSLFTQKDLDSERKVIFEEIRMYEDNPSSAVDDKLEAELFRGSSLERLISGTVKTMTGIGRKKLLAYRNAHYVPEKTVIAVAGKFDENETLAMLEKTFGTVAKKKAPPAFKKFSVAKAGYRTPRIKVEHRDTEQVQLAMGWPSYGYSDARLHALRLMTIILGGNMSSRLFLEVREKRGLAYSVRASSGPFQDIGNVTISAGLSKERVQEAVMVICKELVRITETLVTKEELERAKEYYKGKMVLGLEDSSSLAEWFAKQELLTKSVATPDERLADTMNVTREDIRAVARDIFRKARTSVSVNGPLDAKISFSEHLDLLP